MYPSIRVRTANPVLVRVRDMVSASLSSAAVESPVLIESRSVNVLNISFYLLCTKITQKPPMPFIFTNSIITTLTIHSSPFHSRLNMLQLI